MEDLILRADNVSYAYEDSEGMAVRGVTLGFRTGEMTAVLGHNGSGKSTLAKLLNGLYIPTEGHVTVCGMDTQEDEHTWDIRRSAGMVFQNPDNQLVASIVRDDVAFGLENIGVPSAQMPARIETALRQVEMLPFIDPRGRREVFDTVSRLNREQGITVVWITHFMEEAARCDRVVVMDDGQVVMDDTPKAVFSQAERLRAMRLDVPPMVALGDLLRARGLPIAHEAMDVSAMAQEVLKCR